MNHKMPPPPPKHLTLHRLTATGSPMEQDFWKVYDSTLNPSYHLIAAINRRLRNLEAHQSSLIHNQNLQEAHFMRIQMELAEANARINMVQTSLFNMKSKLPEEPTGVRPSEQSVVKEVSKTHPQLTLNQLLNLTPGTKVQVGLCSVAEVPFPKVHQPTTHQQSSSPQVKQLPSQKQIAQPPKKRPHIIE